MAKAATRARARSLVAPYPSVPLQELKRLVPRAVLALHPEGYGNNSTRVICPTVGCNPRSLLFARFAAVMCAGSDRRCAAQRSWLSPENWERRCREYCALNSLRERTRWSTTAYACITARGKALLWIPPRTTRRDVRK
jgi:hypothetical protein